MNFKTSVLAASVALILAGCGSDDAPSIGNPGTGEPSVGVERQGQFIDATVEGLYFVSMPSGKSGWTDNKGQYQSEKGDTITFYLGGKDGLKVGASSDTGNGQNGVISPFDTAGKYDRAVTLARILQTIDTNKADPALIVIPDELRANISETALNAASIIQLDDFSSAQSLLEELNISAGEWVSESDAISHMTESLNAVVRGSNERISTFDLDNGTIIKQLSVSQSKDYAHSPLFNYVHADMTMSPELIEQTSGMDFILFTFHKDGYKELAGSNDGGISEGLALQYLSCENEYPGQWKGSYCDIDGNGVQNDNESNFTNSKFDLGSAFSYRVQNKAAAYDADYSSKWASGEDSGIFACAPQADGCTAEKLNKVYDVTYDDRDEDAEYPAWQRSIESGSYDPVTGIYSVSRKKIELNGEDCNISSECTETAAITQMEYYYSVPSKEQDRYVDFTGTWEIVTSKPTCESVAKSTMTFGPEGVTIAGDDFTENCEIAPMEEDSSTPMSIDELPGDYWWFGQTGREMKATLTELNSTVRWCDDNDDEKGTDCTAEYFNKWEYQPSGADWDKGILSARKMTKQGVTVATHYMQKVSN